MHLIYKTCFNLVYNILKTEPSLPCEHLISMNVLLLALNLYSLKCGEKYVSYMLVNTYDSIKHFEWHYNTNLVFLTISAEAFLLPVRVPLPYTHNGIPRAKRPWTENWSWPFKARGFIAMIGWSLLTVMSGSIHMHVRSELILFSTLYS